MGKFVIKCPTCANNGEDIYITVNGGLFNSGLFAKKKVQCPHGHNINIVTDRMALKRCSHCGNNVVYDQSKGESAVCPVCKTKLNTLNDNIISVKIKCPQCGCTHTVAKDGSSMECPVCNAVIDIQREIGKLNMREENTVSLIKYEGNNDIFVWKHPIEDFKWGSQLIVHDSQEALFFCGGNALDLFGGGTYTLTTENVPLLSTIYPMLSGERTFHSEIYFINKTVHTGIKWGTSRRIRVIDPYSGMSVTLGAFGTFNLRVSDSKRLVLKLVGTTDIFRHSHNINTTPEDGERSKDSSEDILVHVRDVILTEVRSSFATIIREKNWSIREIDLHYKELAENIRQNINPELSDYGLTVPDFFIGSVSTPEDSEDRIERENYKKMLYQSGERYLGVTEEQNREAIAQAAGQRKITEAETEARLRVIKAESAAASRQLEGLAEAAVQRAQGYTGKDKLAYEVQKTLAENIGDIGGNESSSFGGLLGLGAGLGLMSHIGSQVKNIVSDLTEGSETVSNPENGIVNSFPLSGKGWTCGCGAPNQTGKFCNECGRPRPALSNTWTCECGAINQTGKYCTECGKPKSVLNTMWDCICGARNQTGKFCSECGRPRTALNDRGEEQL